MAGVDAEWDGEGLLLECVGAGVWKDL